MLVNLPVQMIQVRKGYTTILGNDLIAGAVVADGSAKRQMKIKRQTALFSIGIADRIPVGPFRELIRELQGRRV